jgi:hypothetical protein
MDGVKISQQNRKAVELVILVEAGTTIQNMDPMKKSSHKEVLLQKYMQIMNKIEDKKHLQLQGSLTPPAPPPPPHYPPTTLLLQLPASLSA